MAQRNISSLMSWGVRIAGAVAAIIGCFWLGAWLFGLAARWSAAGVLTMKTNMALTQILAGAALLLLRPGKAGPSRRAAGMAAAALVLLIGALTLSEHLFHYNLGIDQILATELPRAVGTVSPNRIGPLGSASLVLLGMGLLALGGKWRMVAPYFGLATLLINLVPAVGFLFGITAFYDQPLTGIAWPTVVGLSSLGIGLMLAYAEGGFMAMLLRGDAGGMLLRRVLPQALLVSLVLGFLEVWGERLGLFDDLTGSGVLALAMLLFLSVLLWRSAMRLSRAAATQRRAEQALHESEERFRATYEQAAVGIEMLTLDGRFLRGNAMLASILGYSDEELRQRTFETITHPDDLPRERPLLEDLLAGRTASYTIEKRYLRKDGRSVWVRVTSSLAKTPEPYRISVIEDITKRRQAEEELRESEQRYSALFEKSPFAIALTKMPEGVTVGVNDAFLKLFEYTREEVIGKTSVDLGIADPGSRVQVAAELQAHGLVRDFECVRTAKSGTRYVLALSLDWVSIGGEKHVLTTIRDITERKRAEEELRRQREWLRVTLSSIGDAVLATDTQGRITFLNPVAESLTGWLQEEALGQPSVHVFRIINEQTRQPGDDLVARVLGERDIVALANHSALVARDGREIPIEDSAAPILDASGLVAGVVLVFHDVTQKRRAQDALRDSESRLRYALEVSETGYWDLNLEDHTAHRTLQHDRIFGYETLLPQWTYEMFLGHVIPEDREMVDGRFRRAMETGEDWNFECRIRRTDGQVRWIWATGRHTASDSGQPRRMEGIVQDITQHKLAARFIDAGLPVRRAERPPAEPLRRSGLEVIGAAPWGTHFCQFYQTAQDLVETLVPYFREGLLANEFCMWVTSEPLQVEQAEAALRTAMPDLDDYLAGGQIEILDYRDWYTRTGTFDADLVLRGWTDKLAAARERGYEGLRLTGNTFWLEEANWEDFTRYEARVNEVIGGQHMLALCTYSLQKCGVREILDVLANHEYALIKNAGRWEVIESARYAQSEQALRESEERLRLAVWAADLGVFEWDLPTDRTIWANPRMYEIFGRSQEDGALGKQGIVEQAIHPDDVASFDAALAEAMTPGNLFHTICRIRRRSDGEQRWVEFSGRFGWGDGGLPLRMTGVVSDITGRRRREEELQKLNRTLKALSNSNQAMMRAMDEVAYLNEICRIVVNDCGHAMVWIGLTEEDEAKTVRPVAYAGFDDGYLETLKVTWADTERGRGPTGTAIRTGKPSMCANMLTDPLFAPWRAEALKRGYASSLVLPLMADGKTFGAITIYSRQPNSFAPDEVALLSELAGDLAYGMTAIRWRQARQRAEEALRESEERFRLFMDNSPTIAWMKDEQGQYVYLSKTYEQRFGVRLEDWRGKTDFELWPAEVAEQFWKNDREVLASGQPLEVAEETPNADGGRSAWLDFKFPFQDAAGRRYVGGMGMDITERRRAETALQHSMRRFELLAETAGTLLQASEPQQVVNSLCEKVMEHLDCHAFFNFLADERAGRLHLNACTGISSEQARRIEWLDYGVAVCGCAARDGCRIVAEHIPTTPDERTELVRSYGIKAYAAHPLLGTGGKVIGTLSFGTRSRETFNSDDLSLMKAVADQVAVAITRMQAEKTLRQSEEALRQVNEQLEQRVRERTAELAWTITTLQDEIRQRERAEQQLKGAVEQLNARAGQLRALAGELTLTEQRERQRMARILHDHLQQLLVAAKFRVTILGRTGDGLVRQAATEVEELLSESINASRSLTAELSPPILHEGGLPAGLEWLARWMADKHGLIVDLVMEDGIPALAEDVKVLLFESVRELLFNAAKHAHVHSVTVNLRQVEGNALQITVSDAGQGFEPEKLKPAGEVGGGFGLFSIRERLGLFGGQMEISSAPGRGSRFILTAPLGQAAIAELPALAPELAEATEQVRVSVPLSSVRIRVLLADDHAVVRQGLAGLLDQEPDIEIVGQATDGQEAVELAGKLLPDVILMDMSMPRLNGIEATRIIHNEFPQMRIIGLSMFEEAERAQALRDAGAVHYLTKSGPAEDLIAAIRACMTQEAGHAASTAAHH